MLHNKTLVLGWDGDSRGGGLVERMKQDGKSVGECMCVFMCGGELFDSNKTKKDTQY